MPSRLCRCLSRTSFAVFSLFNFQHNYLDILFFDQSVPEDKHQLPKRKHGSDCSCFGLLVLFISFFL